MIYNDIYIYTVYIYIYCPSWIHFVGYPCHFSSRSKLCEVHISMRDAGQTTWRKPLQLTAMSSGRACRLTLPSDIQWHSWSMLKFLLKLVSFDFKLKLVKGSRRQTDPEGSKRPCSSRRGSNSGDVPCRSRPLELLALQVFEMGLWFATSPASNSRDGWHSHNFIQFLCYSGRSSGHAFWKHAQIKERVRIKTINRPPNFSDVMLKMTQLDQFCGASPTLAHFSIPNNIIIHIKFKSYKYTVYNTIQYINYPKSHDFCDIPVGPEPNHGTSQKRLLLWRARRWNHGNHGARPVRRGEPDLEKFFSPNSVSKLRGSYGRCKGRCLIRVLQLGRGTFPVNFRVKRLLWHVDLHFDYAGSLEVWVPVLGSVFLPNVISSKTSSSSSFSSFYIIIHHLFILHLIFRIIIILILVLILILIIIIHILLPRPHTVWGLLPG